MTSEEKFKHIQDLFFDNGLSDKDGHMTIFGYYYASETFGQDVANKINRIFWPQGAYVLNVSMQEDVKTYVVGEELSKDITKWNLLRWNEVTDGMFNNLIQLFGINTGRWLIPNGYYNLMRHKFERLTSGQVQYNMVIKEFFTENPDFEYLCAASQYDFTSPEWTEIKL